MLKKRLGIEGIETVYPSYYYLKIPSTLIIPESCEEIGSRVFKGCRWLEKVVIPESVKRIGTGVFEDCKNLKEVVIPESVERIGDYAFAGCIKLEKIKVPKDVKELGEGTFYCCRNAEIILKKPESEFKKIASNAFLGVRDVKEEIRD